MDCAHLKPNSFISCIQIKSNSLKVNYKVATLMSSHTSFLEPKQFFRVTAARNVKILFDRYKNRVESYYYDWLTFYTIFYFFIFEFYILYFIFFVVDSKTSIFFSPKFLIFIYFSAVLKFLFCPFNVVIVSWNMKHSETGI
jgi:hypothetical protein